jgi:rubrerythrin
MGVVYVTSCFSCFAHTKICVNRLNRLDHKSALARKGDALMENRQKLAELVQTQIMIENEHVKRLGDLEKKMGTPAARLLLLEMRLDSQKHAGILTGILEMMEKVPTNETLREYTLEGYVDPVLVKKSLQDHVRMETDVLDHVESELKHTKDEGLKLLLKHIQGDEKKHHAMLKTIIQKMYKITP